MVRCILIYLQVFILLTGVFSLRAKTIPLEAPIQAFRLPIFGDQGYKSWDIEGKEACFSGDSQSMVVQGMRLRIYSGGDPLILEATLESPQAHLFPKNRRAEGHEYVFLTTRNYNVVGYGWSWEELPHTGTDMHYKVILKSDVKITFKSDLAF
jgi:hypothetical protein